MPALPLPPALRFFVYRMKSSVLGVLLFKFGGMISCTVNVAKPTSGMFSVERVRPFVPMVPLKDHHFVASQTNQILHFPKLREQENLLQKKNQLEEIRLKAVEKRASKLTPVEHFEECCSRSTSPPATKVYIACSACCDWLSVSVLCRKCLTDGIPEPVLKQCRNRFLNYPTREQRKSYILSLRTPRAR